VFNTDEKKLKSDTARTMAKTKSTISNAVIVPNFARKQYVGENTRRKRLENSGGP